MKLTEEQLARFVKLAHGGENLPPSDDYLTLAQWHHLLKSSGTHIGEKRLRQILTEHGEIFYGTKNDSLGKPNRQVWYRIDLSKL